MMSIISKNALINFSAVQAEHPAAGPGLRTEVFFFGCSRGCPGCINQWVQDLGLYNTETAETIAKYIYKLGNPRISISGGEPFEQIKGLLSLLFFIQKEFDNKAEILLYTGNDLEDIQDYCPILVYLVTYLVTGIFIQDFAYTKIENSFVGSSNQIMYQLPFFKELEVDVYGKLKDENDL